MNRGSSMSALCGAILVENHEEVMYMIPVQWQLENSWRRMADSVDRKSVV